MRYAYYYSFCVFIILYSISGVHGKEEKIKLPPSIPPDPVFGFTDYTIKKNKMLAAIGAYCKSIYTAKEAEELLDFTSKYFPQTLYWWKRWGMDIRRPMCSALPAEGWSYPKRSALASKPVSDDKYFQSRNVRIPVNPGRMRVHTNEFLYVDRKAVQRPFLECSCDLLGDQVGIENICVEGTTVYLSKGVCDGTSFFVHTPSWPYTENFNVVAHINFDRSQRNV